MSSSSSAADQTLGFEKLFRVHHLLWLVLGQKPKRYRGYKLWLYYAHSAFVNVFIAIVSPLHLIAGVFALDSIDDIFGAMRGTLRAVLPTTKSFTIWYKMNLFKEIEEYMRQLEERIKEPEDREYLQNTIYTGVRRVRNIIGSFFLGELIVGIIFTIKLRKVPFPAYFVFDPYKSTFSFMIALLYQDLCGTTHEIQAFIVDTYSTMCLGIMAGHVHLLGRRVSRIGYDKSKSLQQNNEELVECIKDHISLLRFHMKFMELFSICLFLQLLLTALNISINCFHIMFFSKGVYDLPFCISNILIILIEIFPICCYCSKLETEFENLSSQIYKCNWMDQNKEFKSSLRIFVEQTLRPVTVKVGGIVAVDLPIFLASCKTAYTIFTVLIQIK